MPSLPRYFSRIPGQDRTGPWTLEDLQEHYRNGSIGPNTPCEAEDGSAMFRYGDLLAGQTMEPPSPPSLPPASPPGGAASADRRDREPTLARQAGADLKALSSHLLLPWQEFSSGRWLAQRRALIIACVGLVPLAIIASFTGNEDARRAYWAIALYFSVLWAVFFYHAFPAPRVNFKDAAFCFVGSALSCTLLLMLIYKFTPLQMLLPWVFSKSLPQVWIGFVGAVGIAEELSKALILVFLFHRDDRLSPHTLLFYGLMAGLGFGIYEGVSYQFQLNWRAAQSVEGYYLLNVLRLTSLPFLHAVWTGIAGYFIGFAFLHPKRRVGLWIVAIGFPALLHGTYNTFSRSLFGLMVALFSVLALNLYLSRSIELDRMLRQTGPDTNP